MAKLTAKEFQEKHAQRLKAAIPDIQRGVERVTENPMAKAGAKQSKMLAGITEAINSGKWKRGLDRVPLDQWKRDMIEKGTTRIASGIDGSAAKVEAFASEFLPYLDTGVSAVKKMPDLTLEDSIARASAMIRHNAKFKRTK